MASLDEVSLAIGELKSLTAQLVKQTDAHEKETKRIGDDLKTLSADMKVVKSDVSAMKPVVRKVQNWEQRAIGVSLIGGLFGGGVLASIKGWLW